MRIVFIIDHLRPDGTQRFLRQIVAGLIARNHQISVLSLNELNAQEVQHELQQAGAEVQLLGRHRLMFGCGIIATWLWLRSRQFDVAVTLLFTSDVIGRILARLAHVPRTISSIRARNTHYTKFQHVLMRLTMPLVDKVVVNSASICDFVVTYEGVKRHQLVVIPNAVQMKETWSIDSTDQRQFILPQTSIILVGVGRLTRQKGFDILIDALTLLPRQDVGLVLFGEGEEHSALEQRIQRLQLSERVVLAGYYANPQQYVRKINLYIHPARFEGMPNALLEAMAFGWPIVATAIDGNRELIEDGIHGWLVEPESPQALAHVIDAALGDPVEAKRRGQAAQQRAQQQFGVKAMVDAWERVLSPLKAEP